MAHFCSDSRSFSVSSSGRGCSVWPSGGGDLWLEVGSQSQEEGMEPASTLILKIRSCVTRTDL